MSRPKRIELTLDQKVALIKESEGKSHRQLAEMYGIGRTQVGSILKRRAEFLSAYEENVEPSRKRLKTGFQYPDIDRLMWDWYQHARALNLPVSGPLMQEKARRFAISLGHFDFKGSSGWLDSFRCRHNIMSSAVCNWRDKLADICEGYESQDIWNVGETGIMFRALPERTLVGQRMKSHLTVFIACNMAGEFYTPLVIGKVARPHAFHKLRLDQLPVTWRANKQAWMTSRVYGDWLQAFNATMCSRGRKALLFVDSAPCHPHAVTPLSHVRVVFLPANTLSVLQPLDQGIVQDVKRHYREQLLRRLLADIERCDSLSEVVKNVSLFDAVQMISAAVDEVKTSTVVRCFAMAGFPTFVDASDDPDEDVPLAQLLLQASNELPLSDAITDPGEYISIDSGIPVMETPFGDWEASLVKDFVCDRNGGISDPVEDGDGVREVGNIRDRINVHDSNNIGEGNTVHDGDILSDVDDVREGSDVHECEDIREGALVREEDNHCDGVLAEPVESINIAEAITMISKVKVFCMEEGLDIWQSAANIEAKLKAYMMQTPCSHRQTIVTSCFKKK
ncbi:hypothetical protein LSH36_244g00018 [Paralvinella palmiformis]|uniref:HTH CENPB-type domain-containing protein n=1 Tax=Paralvinella palmiformis TaxID=53620 RepID=A0AAD9N3E1_9ANNE|nr:hypothetical protein LSH36_244g00018 [Paralvinella palmiformis]